MNKETEALLKQAQAVYKENFSPVTWYGRCIFLSWYCDLGTCKFCFRSTVKHKIKHAPTAKRTLASVLVEALLCKHLGWRIEFLTGGYKIFPMKDLINIAKLVSEIYGEKIWLNLGVIKPEDLKQFQPYVKGIVSSIETIEPNLHNEICPDKPIGPYEEMFSQAKDFKKSMTIVIGLGEKKEDFELLKDFINKHDLQRITFYALKPVKGTPYENTNGPDTEDYLWWIAQTRISFPKLEIIAGTTARRYEEVGLLMQAGANAFTKFPATKMFGTEQAKRIEADIKAVGRELKGSITKLPDINWNEEINKLQIDSKLKEVQETQGVSGHRKSKTFSSDLKEKLEMYLKRMRNNSNTQLYDPES